LNNPFDVKRTQMKNNEKIWKLEYLEPLVNQGSYEDDDEIKEESTSSK